MAPSKRHEDTSALRRLEELPGIADVVWAMVTRFAGAPTPSSVLFTAAEGRAGTSVLACATAIGLAQHQRVPVCLIETHVQRPALAAYLGLESAGLSDVLDGRAELEDCLQEPRDCPGLLVLPAGTARAPVSGEFTTYRMTSILAKLEQRCHYLLLDAPPVVDHVESRLLLRHADAVLLVLRARATLLCDAERAHDILVESGIPVLGSIFNAFRADGLSGVNARANRVFERAVRAERPRARMLPPPLREAAASAGVDGPPRELEERAAATNGDALAENGVPAFEVLTPAPAGSEATHRQQVDILERRIVKLTLLLEQTEAELRRIALMKNIDLGIASIYRGVQGLSAEEEARALKSSILQKIFQANLELKTAMTRRPYLPSTG